jgi:transcriptional regulator
MDVKNINDREWKKGSAEMLVLAVLEQQPQHGYEIAKQIEIKSGGALRFHAASLYPLLYKLEKRKWIKGRWVEKTGQRRRRYYRMTDLGRQVLEEQRRNWIEFVAAISKVVQVRYA